ncbi:MAG TPA: hydroxysqualene dehydroxylase HpnE [Acidimicrobiales bacterium]|nr:hydroxysqualene dehydroxylase HpnE [Acidimicrobiales bacterium]
MSGARVVVVGGGLAGIGAALDLADAGCDVVLLERRRRLGGLTWSYERDGRSIDNGQHVFLRCCSAYTGFLDRIGSAGDVELQPRLDLTVLAAGPGGEVRRARLRRDGLPAPAHLARALLAYGHLRLLDRARIGLAALPLRSVDLDDPALDDETFGSWLRRHGQSTAAVAALWDLITVPTVNLPADACSAAMGAKVFQTGLLRDAAAADVGWARIPLGELHGERAAAALAKAGVEVRLGARIGRVEETTAGVTAGDVDADVAVVAVPSTEARAVLPAAAADALVPVEGLSTSAVVDVHLTFDRRVSELGLFATLDPMAQWVFDRTASSGAGGPGQYLAVSLSAADEHLGTPNDDLVAAVTAALRRVLPAARLATVTDAFVTKERTATFRAGPGSRRLRPGPATASPRTFLAGAYTDTGWPATMEGAVRSGRRAARAALVATGTTRSLPQEVA